MMKSTLLYIFPFYLISEHIYNIYFSIFSLSLLIPLNIIKFLKAGLYVVNFSNDHLQRGKYNDEKSELTLQK